MTKSDTGDLIKWNIGKLEKGTIDYHYNLLELYKYEELKINTNKLHSEGIEALNKGKLMESLEKFKNLRNELLNYLS